MIDLRIAAAGAALAVAFGAGWTAQGWRMGAAADRVARQHAEAVSASNRSALVLQKRLDAEQEERRGELARLDAEGLARLKEAQDETNRLQRCIADGTCGLRIRTTQRACPAGDVPGVPDAGRVDHGAGGELAADSRQDYFALREGLTRMQEKLAACQQAHRIKSGP